MQSIDNVLKLRKGLKPDDPNPDIFDVLWAKKLSGAAKEYTITGNPLNFTAKKAQTAKSTKVTLKPVQNLHGYDNPWPAGGNKNKFDPQNLVHRVITPSVGGLGDENDTYRTAVFGSLKAGTYTFSTDLSSCYILRMQIGGDTSGLGEEGTLITISVTANTYTFTLESDSFAMISFRKSPSAEFTYEPNVQLESGSTATSYVPFSNICPISGRSSVEIKGCGKNIIETVADNVIYSSANRNVIEFNNDVISFTPTYVTSTAFFLLKIFKVTSGMVGKTFTYSYQSSPSLSTYNSTFVFCDEDGGNRTSVRNNHQIIESEVGKIFTMRFYSSDNTKTYTISQIQVEEGTSATYEPYTESNDVTITFPAVGKNVAKPYQYAPTLSGVSIEYDGNGKVTVNGSTDNNFATPISTVAKNNGYYMYLRAGTYTPLTYNNVSIQIVDYDANILSTDSSFTISQDTQVYIRIRTIANTVYNNAEFYLMLVEGSQSPTSYEPYTNTVYSGTLDVETGVLTVNKTIVTIKDYDWLYDSSSGGFFKYAFSSKKRNDDYMISTVLIYSSNTASNMPPYSMKQGASTYPTRIIIKMPSGVTTRNQLFELIGDEKIVFNLNTPTTIQLTPEQIQILKGQNTIWIEDEGATIALTYKN